MSRTKPTECRCGKRRHRLTKAGVPQNVAEHHSEPCEFCRLERARSTRGHILDAVSWGVKFKEIAFDLGLSKETVRLHWVAACREIGLQEPNIALATRWVMMHRDTPGQENKNHCRE